MHSRIYVIFVFFFLAASLTSGISMEGFSELMRKCPRGLFGFKCNFRCNCRDNRLCDPVNGNCTNGCRDGFWGEICQLANHCFYNGQKRNYMGTLAHTKSGYTCQRWDSQIPHAHNYGYQEFPDRSFPRNYCRTTPDSDKPWCYTTDLRTRWEYCSIRGCVCPAGRYGLNCKLECHCLDNTEQCNYITGNCASGCAQGWTGFGCQTAGSCPANRYGWDCEHACKCQDPDHCDRFLGPSKKCVCTAGFYNAPTCEPMAPPKISFLGNKMVNPGQPALFNCTVFAIPTPNEDDIRLDGPIEKTIVLNSTFVFEDHYLRINTFEVSNVMKNEHYTCVAQTAAGTHNLSVPAHVYELPRLKSMPSFVLNNQDATSITLTWHPWNKARGDMGDGPIESYDVHFKHTRDYNFTFVGRLKHNFCRNMCSFTITNLQPNSEYKIYVSTNRYGNGGNGPQGQPVNVTTKCTGPQQAPVIKKITSELQHNVTYPRAKIVITFKDPPYSTLGCNRIEKYFLHLTPESSILTDQNSKVEQIVVPTNSEMSLPDLDPYTQYCVYLEFENDHGKRSPRSERECIVTPQAAPKAPRDVEIQKVGSSNAILSWRKPSESYGIITRYQILFWEVESSSLETLEMESQDQDQIVQTLAGLKAGTHYSFKIKAVNSAGAGQASEVMTFVTKEGAPGPISQLTNTSRTSTSIELKWQLPSEQNRHLLNFHVHCQTKMSLSRDLTTHQRSIQYNVSPDVLEQLIQQLSPATLYECSVKARTKKGLGEPAILKVWTEPEVLKPPPSPEIIEVTGNTVKLKLHESHDRTIRYYRLIIERLDSDHNGQGRKPEKRHAPRYVEQATDDFHTALRESKSTYVTAQFLPHDLRGMFIIGDNSTYEGYFNGPLQQDHKYWIWLGGFSDVDGVMQQAFVRADKPVIARSLAATDSSSSIPVIIGVVVVFILLITILAALLLIWRRRHIAEEHEKADIPSFGPAIIPEPDTSTPSSPLDATVAPVKVEDLWDYIRSAKQNDLDGLKREYRLLPSGITATCEVARRNGNKMKNRYGNIIAYDHTRVVLDIDGEDQHDDYINANYIDGYNKQRAYIAAQGPSKPTLNDIWRMIWKENSKTLIMLTNPTESGKKKCEQYWPDEGCEQYGNISVQLLNVDILPDFTIRTFLISKGGQSKYMKQFHYTTWPDHGVPRFGHSLLLFRQKIRAYDSMDNGTVIIHCSAGVGRTGTYIAVDTQLEKAKSEGMIDVYNFVQLMRTQRVNMVQTLEQYVFVYDCLLEALICGDTTVSSHAFPEVYADLCLFDTDISKTKLEEQFEILKLLSTTIERDESSTALSPENIFKNRCKNIIPANRCRPYLMTTCDAGNDYINAVFLNSYCKRDDLIVTQMPLPDTIVDFWRLVYDHKSLCIVMLNEVETNDDTCAQYWTENPGGELYGPFQVETTSEIKSNPIVTVRDFTLSNTEEQRNFVHIRQFHFHRWQEGSATPSSQRALLELVHLADTWQLSHDGPIVVHCMNGASRSGLFCAALTILERVKKEKEVDVFQAVKQLRLNRTQLIDNMEQYQFCHELVMEYLSSPESNTVLS